jgi:hypothetical protein
VAKTLVGKELNREIALILKEESVSCAAAFWGKGAAKKLAEKKRDQRLICNLRFGGTNPFEIEKIPTRILRQSDTLHAKVYIGNERAVVSSANVSSNGLGLENGEQANWIEAGVLLENILEISAWFQDLWEDSREISDGDLENAKKAWNNRQRSKPTALSFHDFDPERSNVPLLYWIYNTDRDYNPAALRGRLGGDSPQTRGLVDDSLPVDPGDRTAMAPGRWLVVWWRSATGFPKRRPKPYWFFTGRVIEKSFRYKGEKKYRDSVLESDSSPQVPFALNESELLNAFIETLSRDEYLPLRDDEDTKQFYTPAIERLNRKFWRECKRAWLESTQRHR